MITLQRSKNKTQASVFFFPSHFFSSTHKGPFLKEKIIKKKKRKNIQFSSPALENIAGVFSGISSSLTVSHYFQFLKFSLHCYSYCACMCVCVYVSTCVFYRIQNFSLIIELLKCANKSFTLAKHGNLKKCIREMDYSPQQC